MKVHPPEGDEASTAGAPAGPAPVARMSAAADLATMINGGADFLQAGRAATAVLNAHLRCDVAMFALVHDGLLEVESATGSATLPEVLQPPRRLDLWASVSEARRTILEDLTADPWPELQQADGITTGVSCLLSAEDIPTGFLGVYATTAVFSADDVAFVDLVGRLLDGAHRHQTDRQEQARTDRLDAVTRVAAGVCHDFAGLLTVALMNLELLEVSHADDEVVQTARSVREALSEGSSLIKELQAFTGGTRGARSTIDVEREVARMRPHLEALVPEGVHLEVETDRADAQITLPTGTFDRLVGNLVANAAEAAQAGGTVRVSVSRIQLPAAAADRLGVQEGVYLRVAVTDDGEGMTDEQLARAIEPYYTTRPQIRSAGRGLGLSVIHGIVTDAGGTLHLDSAPGAGTTATLYVPADA